MTKLVEWVKTHKANTFLLAIVAFFIVRAMTSQNSVFVNRLSNPSYNGSGTMGMLAESAPDSYGTSVGAARIAPTTSYKVPAPPSDATTRMVTKDTTLSLKVDNVESTVEKIEQASMGLGGYLIDSNVSIPEGASSGTISVRVPSEKRTEALRAFKGLAVKTVSEYVSGQDITDQYVDNEERLRILESTKAKFETILADAKNVTEMLNVQQQLLSLQQQIDAIKGQQKYLEGSAKYSRISVYLSTDELALPYAPDTSWRPGVVFKTAVRSLIQHLRFFGSALIWLVVYLPVVLVAGIIILILKRVLRGRM